MKTVLAAALAMSVAAACDSSVGEPSEVVNAGPDRGTEVASDVLIGLDGDTLARLELSDEEWAERLDEEAFDVLFENGTERAFTSELLGVEDEGMFVCKACQLPVYSSATKFKSGTGWPSFYAPVRGEHVREVRDDSYGMSRVEVRCARCDGHHGHVFPDGPQPTGLRYCINGDALSFVEGPTSLPSATP